MENPPKIEAFGGQLNQVFMNILDNAVGAIKDHGDIWIRIGEDKSKKNLVIEIEDNGIGMSKDQIKYIFERFFKADPSRARMGTGESGLGLAIVSSLIKQHGGKVTVESEPGKGSTFTVVFYDKGFEQFVEK